VVVDCLVVGVGDDVHVGDGFFVVIGGGVGV